MYDREPTGIAAGASYKTKFVVAVDQTTHNILTAATATKRQGVMQGYQSTGSLVGGQIRIDQGMSTSQISPASGLDSDLLETQFIVELDYRLGRLARPNAQTVQNVNFIDDDSIASYYVAGTNFVSPVNNTDSVASASAQPCRSKRITLLH